MNRFYIYCFVITAVPGGVIGLTCNRSAIGYSCLWNSPTDDGGEAVTYCYGHVSGSNAVCPPPSSNCHLNSGKAEENALQQGTSYLFYVYAVNSVGRGNCSTEIVTTVLGTQIVSLVVHVVLGFLYLLHRSSSECRCASITAVRSCTMEFSSNE